MKEIQTISEKGIDFLCREEGLRLAPYLDCGGRCTIGYGSTYWENGARVQMTDKAITRERARSLFRTTLHMYEKAVWSSTRDDINQHQFDALVSLTYNIGVAHFQTSTVLRKVNQNKDDPTIAQAFELWKFCEAEPILLPRRKREAKLYFS